jgi:hypothetical protein
MYKIEIDHQLKIIRYTHSGFIQRSEMGLAWQEIMGISEFTSSDYHLLTDFRGADFRFTKIDRDVVWKFLESIKPILCKKVEAVLVDNPVPTAISMLFEFETEKRIGFKVKSFSTEQAALK